MPPTRKKSKRNIENYAHTDKERANNPPVGLVTPDTDKDAGRTTYAHDPHIDPQLHWAGKAEHPAFAVPTVSLHMHERIDPRTIVEAVRKRNGAAVQGSLFAAADENPPLRHAIEFYRHRRNWTNRLVAGDSLLVMNSLLEKEGLGGQVPAIYLDPPYSIRYGSNFQPFVNKRDVTDGRDEDLTQEPETIRAFRDTWELGIHSYLTYLRDRLLLARELLHDSGSCFVQISDENLHHVRELMDEVFGVENFVSVVSIRKTTSQGTAVLLGATTDFIVWYVRNRSSIKYRQLFIPRSDVAEERYDQALLPDGSVVPSRTLTESQEKEVQVFQLGDLTSSRPTGAGDVREFEFLGRTYTPGKGTFKTHKEGLERLAHAGRLQATSSGTLNYRRFKSDFSIAALGNLWNDVSGAVQSRSDPKVYVVQSSTEVIERCILMTTDPGDLVFDPSCGSGTTAYVAEQWGRRWITCDTSRVAVTLAKQRLTTAAYDYYELAHPDEGVGSGFTYKTVPHVTLGSIANNPDLEAGMTPGADRRRHRPPCSTGNAVRPAARRSRQGARHRAVHRRSRSRADGAIARRRGCSRDLTRPSAGGSRSGPRRKHGGRIALWLLDPDYDRRSLFPRQAFFPMAGAKDGWAKLARNLRAEIDETRIEAYRGTISLPFETGEHRRVAVKIVNDRGIESLKIVEVKP